MDASLPSPPSPPPPPRAAMTPPPSEEEAVNEEWVARFQALFWAPGASAAGEPEAEPEGGAWRAEVDRVLQEWNGRLRAFFRLEEPSPGAARWLRSREAVFRDWNRRFRELFVWRAPPAVAGGIDASPYLLKPWRHLEAPPRPEQRLEDKWHGRRRRARPAARIHSADRARPPPPAHPPRMSVCIMIVGTRGDVQPFLGLARRLQADGHRVRLATHAVYRELVTRQGVEFFPLGGDPKALASYMVKTGGRLIPMTLETLQKDVPRNMRMIDEILTSTWPAASAPDPDARGPGQPGEPFRADAIISNPVTYGHVHVAEKLGVPLHIMFPQPWVPTVAFPHPLSNLPYSWRPQRRNYLSYKVVDLLMWEGTERLVNRFRERELGLRRVRKGDGGRDLLLDRQVPHAFMWSPALVPKPADWGDLYDVVGGPTARSGAAGAAMDYAPTPELEAFLAAEDGPPVFVGFGSMVLQDPLATTRMIIEAAARARVRVLIQSSWSDMAGGLAIPEHAFFLGECPHEWLLPRVAAVVHHGGAGTTAGGLLAGKPTFVVPFFGDQPFWGRAVERAGVGVEPCPIAELSVERLRAAFAELLRPELRARAERLAAQMRLEDGVEGAVQSFYRHLPTARMWCDGCREHIPTRWSVHDRAKLCARCSAVMEARPENYWKRVVDYRCVSYRARRDSGARYAQPHALARPGDAPPSGLAHEVTGAVAFLHEVAGAMKDVSHFLVLSCFSSWDVVAVV